MAAQRLSSIVSQLVPGTSPVDAISRKSPDDVVITLALRTPMCKAGRGGLKDTTLDGLVFKILEQVRLKSQFDPRLVDDICLGNVRDGKAAYYSRVASLAAGFPNTTTASSISRFCSSGLTATQFIANEIWAGVIDVGIAVGAESLSEGNERLSRPFVDEIMNASQEAVDCMLPMGATSENVAKDFNISRQWQDEYAVESYRRAEHAQKAGWFSDEIAPIVVNRDGKQASSPFTVATLDRMKRALRVRYVWALSLPAAILHCLPDVFPTPLAAFANHLQITIDHDEIRHGTTYAGISKLKPSFAEYGDTTHAGNASQITDGAAALILMRRSKAEELGQKILAKYVDTALAGLPPRIMGIGPVFAIPKLLARHNLDLHRDIDVIEINEAFSSMAVYCRDELKLDWTKMNPRGGAVALGHPFGCTGVRQIVCGLSECRRTGKKVLLTSMCLGTGMGMAGLFVSEI